MKHLEGLSLYQITDELLCRFSPMQVLAALAASMRRRCDILALGWETCAEADWLRCADEVSELGSKLPQRLR